VGDDSESGRRGPVVRAPPVAGGGGGVGAMGDTIVRGHEGRWGGVAVGHA
jgi:hypothetical protein